MKTILIIPIVISISVLVVFSFSFFSVEIPTLEETEIKLNPHGKCKALITEQMEMITNGYNPEKDLKRATEIQSMVEKLDCERFISKQEFQDMMIKEGLAQNES